MLVAALVLALLGGWGLHSLLGRLRLSAAERLALTLALLPATLGLMAFFGLLAGRPGPLLPALACVVLGAAGGSVAWGRPSPPSPLSLCAGEGETCSDSAPSPAHRERGLGGEGLPA